MLYVGLDVHKEFCQACVIDERGRVLSNERFPSTHESLDVFLAGIEHAKFVLESTGIWEYIYEGIIYWMLKTREPYHCQGFNPVRKPAPSSA